MSRRNRLTARPRLERLDERCVLSALTPALLDSAYGLNAVTFSNGSVKGTGAGQTIAIVDSYHTPTIASDLAAFDQKYGLPALATTSSPARNSPTSTAAGSFSVVHLAGSATDAGWGQETALDVEWAHAAAPGANIVLVEAASANTRDLLAAVNAAKAIPGVSVVSMSWGSSEFSGQTTYDNVFTTPAGHAGITFLASAGDSGAGAEWPASSPNVVAVGGTSLVVSSSGARLGETYWSGTGGGYSQFEAEPSYQRSVQSSGHRAGPDVAAVADPATGVIIVAGGQQLQVGGTSLSSPVWAGLIAIADQGLAVTGKASLDGPTQTLPRLYAAPSGSFFDVTSGPGARATRGFDTATGLGSPNAGSLIPYLAPAPPKAVTATSGAPATPVANPVPVATATGGSSAVTSTGSGKTTAITAPTPQPIATPKPPQKPQPPAWNSPSNWWSGYWSALS